MSLPLAGLRIVVTRAVHQANELAEPLAALGAEVIFLPVIGIAPPEDSQPLAEAIQNINLYDWIIFTSTNGVRALGRQVGRARVATVGAATRAFAQEQGWRVDLTPETYVAESLVGALGKEAVNGKRILIPSAAITRDVVRDELARLGATVNLVEAYRNVLPPEASDHAKTVFQLPYPDWITFASSSAVDNLTGLVGTQTLRQSKIASIGPITSKTVQRHGLEVSAEAEPHDVLGLVNAIVATITINRVSD